MDRSKWLAVAAVSLFAVVVTVLLMVSRGGGQSIRIGPFGADDASEGGISVEESGASTTTAASPDDPVPMPLVQELFDLLDEAGFEPAAEGTYTVQFVDSVDKVRISGVFADGKEHEFVFVSTGGDWEIEE